MLSKKKKIIILSTMLLLLIVTGYLNLRLNGSNATTTTSSSNTTTTNFFTSHREYRQETRQQEILYYDAIISSSASTQEAINTAQEKKLEIVALMEQELVLEGLIKGKGFEDCVVTISDESVKAIVKASELDKSQVAQITSILQEQLNTDIGNIVIMNI